MKIIVVQDPSNVLQKGGEGSGNFGHEGRPGEVGGSTEEGNNSAEDSGKKYEGWGHCARYACDNFKDKAGEAPYVISDDHGPLHVVTKYQGKFYDQYGSYNSMKHVKIAIDKDQQGKFADPETVNQFYSGSKITWDQAEKMTTKQGAKQDG